MRREPLRDLEPLSRVDWQFMDAPQKQTAISLAIAVLATWIGVVANHAQLAKLGKRKIWSVLVIFELVVGVALAMMVDGAADYFELRGRVSIGLCAAVGYLGPRVIEQIVAWVAVKYQVPTEPRE